MEIPSPAPLHPTWPLGRAKARFSEELTSRVNGWLCDASFLLELRKPSPDPAVAAWSDAQPRKSFFVSAATIAAIRHYAEPRCEEPLRTEVEVWLDDTLKSWFAERILPVKEDIILEWLRIRHRQVSQGADLDQLDLLVAATARVSGLTVCTRDARACLLAGVPAINPWQAPLP